MFDCYLPRHRPCFQRSHNVAIHPCTGKRGCTNRHVFSTTNTTSGNKNLPNTTDAGTYIVTLKNQSSSDDLDDIIQSVEQKGANVTHVYSHSVIGFSVQIPSDKKTETIDLLENDTRVNTIEPDQIMTLSPPLE